MPVSVSIVLTVQAGPAEAKAELKIPVLSATVVPSSLVQAGIFTTESLGILTAIALFLSFDKWIRIVVSLLPGPPYSTSLPNPPP